MDPLATNRSWLTPYNYAQNSPLNRIDPSGMTDYELKKNGRIVERKETHTDEGPDRLIRGKARYKKGTLKNNPANVKEVKKGTFENLSVVRDEEGEAQAQSFTITSDHQAEDLYGFIADYINKEMAKYQIRSDKKGDYTTFLTSFDDKKVRFGSQYLDGVAGRGDQLIDVTHNHPNVPGEAPGSSSPSTNKDEDTDQARFVKEMFKNNQQVAPTFHIYRPYNNYTPYDENGIIKE